MKKYLLIIICLTMALMSYTAKAAVLPACTGSATLNADQTECATKADTQQLTISKVMLCPTAPTLNRALGAAMTTTGCKSIFSNAAGALITISDQPIDPANEVTDQELDAIPAQTYEFVYAELGMSFQITNDSTFNNTMTGTAGANAGPVGAILNQGPVCWTRTLTLENWRANSNLAAVCGTQAQADATKGTTTSHFNVIDGSLAAQIAATPGFTAADMLQAMYITLVDTGGEFACALLQANNTLAAAPAIGAATNVANPAAKLACWAPKKVRTYPNGKTRYIFKSPYTAGMNVNMRTDVARRMLNFGVSDFEFDIQTEKN